MHKGLLYAVLGAAALLLFIVLVVQGGTLQSEPAGGSAGSAFTYQGQLEQNGEVVDGACDLRFSLWDAASGGNQFGSNQTLTGVTIEEGLFTVQLNGGGEFGTDAFNGEARWLEVEVSCPGDAAFTTLGRQELTATPYAQYALSAPWDGLVNVPTGFADGIDDDTTYTAGEGLELIGTEFQAKGSPYGNVVIVAQSGGDFTSIQTALDSITDAAADNRYLVWVAPGVYAEQVIMKPYVDVAGAGELLTKITSPGGPTELSATLFGFGDNEIRSLTVENTGGDNYALAVYTLNSDLRMSDVTVTASGGVSFTMGIVNDMASARLHGVRINTFNAGLNNYGILNINSDVSLRDLDIETVSGSTENYAIYNWAGTLLMRDVTSFASDGPGALVAGFATAQDALVMVEDARFQAGGAAQEAVGMLIMTSSWVTGTNVVAEAENLMTISEEAANPAGTLFPFAGMQAAPRPISPTGLPSAFGMVGLEGGSAHLSNSVLRAMQGADTFGAYSDGVGGKYVLLNSEIAGLTNSVLIYTPGTTTYIGGSWLAGGSVSSSGPTLCAGVYDETFTFYVDSCP